MLTSTPRLFYIDPDVMDIKGEIPWNDRNSIKCTEVSVLCPSHYIDFDQIQSYTYT